MREDETLTWPIFHISAWATVTLHTKPPSEGPSRPMKMGMSPVKLMVPTAYLQQVVGVERAEGRMSRAHRHMDRHGNRHGDRHGTVGTRVGAHRVGAHRARTRCR